MSRRANPTSIGLFVVGAIVLALLGVGALGSNWFWTSRTTFVSYFNESVNGLDVGAPVKFKGVPIGEVSDVKIRIDLEDETFQVPVQYAIDLEPVTDTTGMPINLDNPELLQDQIERGLRAQLQLESFVTGQLYVELTYVSDPETAVQVRREAPYPEIPTELSPLARLGEGASGLVTSLQQFDVTRLNENLMTLLVNANEKLEALDTEEVSRTTVSTIESIQALVESEEVRTTLQDMPEATDRLNQTLGDTQELIDRLNESVDPTTQELQKTGEELRATLEQMRRTLEDVDRSLSTDSGLGYQVDEVVSNLAEVTEALRVLLRSLEQNPGMFLRGRQEAPPSNEPPSSNDP